MDTSDEQPSAAAIPPPRARARPFARVPVEVLMHIFRYMVTDDGVYAWSTAAVCRNWRDAMRVVCQRRVAHDIRHGRRPPSLIGADHSDAMRDGHVGLAQWVVANGSRLSMLTCEAAARGGHLELLKFARESGAAWSTLTCTLAMEAGHHELAEWARKNGAPWCEWRHTITADGCHVGVLWWSSHGARPSWGDWTCSRVVVGGGLGVRQWARAAYARWADPICTNSSGTSSRHSSGLPMTDSIRYQASRSGVARLETERLQWTRGARNKPVVLRCGGYLPAIHRHDRVLEWAQTHGWQWDTRAAWAAARKFRDDEANVWEVGGTHRSATSSDANAVACERLHIADQLWNTLG